MFLRFPFVGLWKGQSLHRYRRRTHTSTKWALCHWQPWSLWQGQEYRNMSGLGFYPDSCGSSYMMCFLTNHTFLPVLLQIKAISQEEKVSNCSIPYIGVWWPFSKPFFNCPGRSCIWWLREEVVYSWFHLQWKGAWVPSSRYDEARSADRSDGVSSPRYWKYLLFLVIHSLGLIETDA